MNTMKNFVQYTYIAEGSIINDEAIVGLGIHKRIEKEFEFQEIDFPENYKKGNLKFRSGRITVDNKDYSIENLSIGNAGLSAWVWGESEISKKVLEKTLELLKGVQLQGDFGSLRRRINYKCNVKTKLDIDANKMYNEHVISELHKFSDMMKMSEFSLMELHFPVITFNYVSKPDVDQIIAAKKPDNVKVELDAASGNRGFVLMCNTTDDYRNRIFTITAETDSETVKQVIRVLETVLG